MDGFGFGASGQGVTEGLKTIETGMLSTGGSGIGTNTEKTVSEITLEQVFLWGAHFQTKNAS